MNRRLFLFCCLVAMVRAAMATPNDPPLILISLDGFRWDYTAQFPAETPTLRALRETGASVRHLIPVFPSNTFPNHYTIVTGLYPANHGIINNDFFDPALGAVFKYNQPGSARDSRWWGGEPIWSTAIKQGRKAAAAFWVGSEAEVGGIRPTYWRPYDGRLPFETRLEELVSWMKKPAEDRPAFVAFYLEDVNGAGHRFGPDSPELAAAIRLSDQRVGAILARLRAETIEPNLIVVSDHGMTATAADRVVLLEDYIDLSSVQIDHQGSTLALRPLDGDEGRVIRAFAQAPHLRSLRAEDLPPHFRLSGNARIPSVWLLPEEGWLVGTKANYERLKKNYPEKGFLAGDHGYDPALPNMQGILIAHGPAFRAGASHDAAENVHVYNLLCAVMKITPAKNDGDDRLARALLQP